MKYGTTKRREKEIRRFARIVAETSSDIYEEHFYLSQAKMYFLRAKNKHGEKWVIFAQHKLNRACQLLAIRRIRGGEIMDTADARMIRESHSP